MNRLEKDALSEQMITDQKGQIMRSRIFGFVVFFIFFSVFLPGVFATEQIQETLIYKGQELALFGEPLNGYFDEQHSRPDFQITCTGELKGYHGTWEVKEGVLYLIKLQKPCPEGESPDIFTENIFHQKAPIKAEWVNGSMRVAVEDKGLLLTFDKGELVREETLDRSPYLDGLVSPGLDPLEMPPPLDAS